MAVLTTVEFTAAFKQLLSVYQGIIDFEDAHKELLGATTENGIYESEIVPGSEKTIQEAIVDATEGKVANRDVARAILGPARGVVLEDHDGQQEAGTYYRSTYTEFKAIGLVTGLNVRNLEELRAVDDAQDTSVAFFQDPDWITIEQPPPAAKTKEELQSMTDILWDPHIETSTDWARDNLPRGATYSPSPRQANDPMSTEPLEIGFRADSDTRRGAGTEVLETAASIVSSAKWWAQLVVPVLSGDVAGMAGSFFSVVTDVAADVAAGQTPQEALMDAATGADAGQQVVNLIERQRSFTPDEALFFMSPAVLQYLVRKGAQAGGIDNPYTMLAKELYGFLAEMTIYAMGEGYAWQLLETTKTVLETKPVTATNLLDFADLDTLETGDNQRLWPENTWPESNEAFSEIPQILPGIQDTAPTVINMAMVNGVATTSTKKRLSDFALGPGGDGEGTNQNYYGSFKDQPPDGSMSGVGRMVRIDRLIRKLIAQDLGLTEENRATRKESRKQQILGFFGIGDAVVEGAIVSDVEEAEAEGILDKIAPEKHSLTPIDFQCFLLEQIRNLSAVHVPDYKNITLLDTGKQPGLVKNKISVQTAWKDIQHFVSICPNVQALLTPYLKISRVTYDNQGKATGKELDLEIPNFVTSKDVSQITQRGRLPGAGVKSFSWSLDGVQPAEVDNNISATLELYFQSVSDFFNAPAAGQTLASDVEPGTQRASYLDLVIASEAADDDDDTPEPGTQKPPACTKKTQEMMHRKWVGDHYRIKAVAGWSTPDKYSLMRALAGTPNASSKADALFRALENSKITLYLQQTRHEFQFSQDGSLTLTVDYQAALSGMATNPSADIFGASGPAQVAALEEAEKAVEKEKEKGETTSEQRENIMEKLEEVKKLRGQDRMIKYKKLLSQLFQSNKIYNMPVSPAELLLPAYSELTPKGRAERAKRRQSAHLKTFAGGQSQNAELLKAVSTAADGDASSDEDQDAATNASDAFSTGLADSYEALEQNADVIWISYFYLGDLLDNVLEQVKENHALEGIPFSFLLSDVEMIDPLVALKIENLEDVIRCKQDLKSSLFMKALVDLNGNEFTEEAGITQLMSIGSIPIAIDAFQVWFKDYVIKKDRDKYYFLHFVKDICAELITRALAHKCFGDVNLSQRFDAQPLTYYHAGGLPATAPKQMTIKTLATKARSIKSTTSPTNTVLGMVLLSTDSKPKGLVGDYEKDGEKGVYHQYLGSPCGLLKTMNFNREDQAYLRESKIQKAGALGPEQLRELYSATLELYGNTLFKNGNYVYLNPKLMGADEEQLRILGLHGYYLITGVSSTVTENSFDVSVKTLHEGIAFRDEILMKPTQHENLKAETTPWLSPAQQAALDSALPPSPPPPPAAAPGTVEGEISEIDSLEQSGAITPERAAYERRNQERAAAVVTAQEEGYTADQIQAELLNQLRSDPYIIDSGLEIGADGTPIGLEPLPTAGAVAPDTPSVDTSPPPG